MTPKEILDIQAENADLRRGIAEMKHAYEVANDDRARWKKMWTDERREKLAALESLQRLTEWFNRAGSVD